MIETGKKVPALSGTTPKGPVSLSKLKGKWIVVYFYPKDSTPGCTLEAQDFRDLYPKFVKRNAEVIGVSRDSVKSHDNFACKQELPFRLVADTDETWCKAFDVIQEKTLYGRKYLGVVRSTFLIDPTGKLHAQWSNVKVKDHAAAVLASIPAA